MLWPVLFCEVEGGGHGGEQQGPFIVAGDSAFMNQLPINKLPRPPVWLERVAPDPQTTTGQEDDPGDLANLADPACGGQPTPDTAAA